MKQRADTRTANFFRPKVAQMIDWEQYGHGSALSHRAGSRDAIGARRGERIYNFLRKAKTANVVIAVTAAQIFANNSP